MDIYLRVLKESSKSRFASYSQEQCIEHIPYYLSGLSRVHLSRNSCRCPPVNPFGFSLKLVYVFKRVEWVFSSVSS